jgi:2-C-methyl-D-erythritol 4-phosphate cytidylyltransferase
MDVMSRTCVIIVAAGKGRRMGSTISKQYLNIKGKPLLFYTLMTFSKCDLIDDIILVTGESEIDYCKDEIVNKYGIGKVRQIVKGGQERQHSVLNGLLVIKNCDIVLIHDGARPFVDYRIIEDGIRFAKFYGACSSGVKPKDTIKKKNHLGFVVDTLDRDFLINVQTPQCFQYDLILDCHKRLFDEGKLVTDDTMVVERYGHKVFLYEGSYSNIKITTPEDLIIGEKIIDNYTY